MNQEIRFVLERKQERIIWRNLQEMFSKKAIQPKRIHIYQEISFLEVIRRSIKIDSAGNEVIMSNSAYKAYRVVVEIYAHVSSECEVCTSRDVEQAIRDVYQKCWQRMKEPESVAEFTDMVSAEISALIMEHTIVAALRGVKLDGVQEVQLGQVRIVASARRLIDLAGVGNEKDIDSDHLQHLMKVTCLAASRIGTFEAAKHWYREQAYLVAGMLAVEAGATYEHAASNFCIEPQFEHTSGATGSIYLFWNDREKFIGRTITAANAGQELTLSAELAAELTSHPPFAHAFEVFQRSNKSTLEESITRAVYWYGDAHRDNVRVMQFVKYWSCLESLLGGNGKDLTETLAVGVVTVLTYGHHRYLEEKDWHNNCQQVKRLYKIRSKAVHRASHLHVSTSDLHVLGSWTAWVIYNALSFSQTGMKDSQDLWSRIQKFVRLHYPNSLIAKSDEGYKSDANREY